MNFLSFNSEAHVQLLVCVRVCVWHLAIFNSCGNTQRQMEKQKRSAPPPPPPPHTRVVRT